MDVVGVDPGPVTGIVRLRLGRNGLPRTLLGAEALQVTEGLVAATLDALDRDCPDALSVAIERFVVGPRSSRSAKAKDGEITREIVAVVRDWASRSSLSCHARTAAQVKPWATDERLAAAGLLETTKGMRHARDAARHALYCAVRTYGLPDPLSRRADR
jgi:hypothetical protein